MTIRIRIGGERAWWYRRSVHRALALLTLLVVLFAGLGTPAFAGSLDVAHGCPVSVVDEHCETGALVEADRAPADTPTSHHLHCTHALDQQVAAFVGHASAVERLVLSSRTTILRSRSQAPPTQPPSA